MHLGALPCVLLLFHFILVFFSSSSSFCINNNLFHQLTADVVGAAQLVSVKWRPLDAIARSEAIRWFIPN